MAKALTLEEQLAGARELKGRRGEAADDEIRKLIGSRYSDVAAVGAEMAGELGREELGAALLTAFGRFLKDGARNDKGCVAKLAIVNALCKLDHREAEIYLQGLRHVQREASFGPPVDTAGELRGRCAIALAESGCYVDALGEVTPLLVDKEGQARVGAVRAVAAMGSDGAAAVLKLKMLTGDAEPVVLGECGVGLLGILGERGTEFVAAVLGGMPAEMAESVASVLAESRTPAVLVVLRRMYESVKDEKVRMTALEALAVLRVDGATEYLLELVEHSLHPRAREVVQALGARKNDERLRVRLESVLERRDDQFLMRLFREAFAKA